MIHLHRPGLISALGNSIAATLTTLYNPAAQPLTYEDDWLPGRRLAVGAAPRTIGSRCPLTCRLNTIPTTTACSGRRSAR